MRRCRPCILQFPGALLPLDCRMSPSYCLHESPLLPVFSSSLFGFALHHRASLSYTFKLLGWGSSGVWRKRTKKWINRSWHRFLKLFSWYPTPGKMILPGNGASSTYFCVIVWPLDDFPFLKKTMSCSTGLFLSMNIQGPPSRLLFWEHLSPLKYHYYTYTYTLVSTPCWDHSVLLMRI